MKNIIQINIPNEEQVRVLHNITGLDSIALDITGPGVYKVANFATIYLERDVNDGHYKLTVTDDEGDSITEGNVSTLHLNTMRDVRYSLSRTLITYVNDIERAYGKYGYEDKNVQLHIHNSIGERVEQAIYDDFISDYLDALSHKQVYV